MAVTKNIDQSVPTTLPSDGSYKPRFFLDIFSGARMPVGTACKQFSVDMFEPVDLSHGWDILDDDTFFHLLCLCESGLIGAALAAPYCCKHSRATLMRPGPQPVRTPTHLDGLPTNTVLQLLAVQELATVHDRARLLLSAVGRSNGLLVLENPASSMTWLDGLTCKWVHSVAPFAAHAGACRFGTDWAKTWFFVSNKIQILNLALSCNHAPNSHESVVGVKLPDGSYKSRLTAEYPPDLAVALAEVIKEFTTCSGQVCPLSTWKSHLPTKLTWPEVCHRIEDGGGIPSSASGHMLMSTSQCTQLRQKWFKRLCDSKDCLKIVAKLETANPSTPLSDEELGPYLADLLSVFQAGHLQDDLTDPDSHCSGPTISPPTLEVVGVELE